MTAAERRITLMFRFRLSVLSVLSWLVVWRIRLLCYLRGCWVAAAFFAGAGALHVGFLLVRAMMIPGATIAYVERSVPMIAARADYAQRRFRELDGAKDAKLKSFYDVMARRAWQLHDRAAAKITARKIRAEAA
jgi:hypothetical protein